MEARPCLTPLEGCKGCKWANCLHCLLPWLEVASRWQNMLCQLHCLQTFEKDAPAGGAAGDAPQQAGDRRGGTPGRHGGGRGGRGGDDRRKSGGRGGGRGEGDKKTGPSLSEDLQKVVKLIHDRSFEPAIVFSFSRRWGPGLGLPARWVGQRVCRMRLARVLCAGSIWIWHIGAARVGAGSASCMPGSW